MASGTEFEWLIVVGHYPLFSNGENGDLPVIQQALQTLFEKYQIDLYLSGHDHTLQHIRNKGIEYVVSGNGALNGHLRTVTVAESVEFAKVDPGFTVHQIKGKQMITSFMAYDGSVLHSYSQIARKRILEESGSSVFTSWESSYNGKEPLVAGMLGAALITVRYFHRKRGLAFLKESESANVYVSHKTLVRNLCLAAPTAKLMSNVCINFGRNFCFECCTATEVRLVGMSSLRLQAVGPDRRRVAITTLTGESNLAQLQQIIAEELKVACEEQTILYGFPPKELCLDDPSVSLSSLNIKSGESFQVKVSGTVRKGIVQGEGTDTVFTIPKNTSGHMAKREMPGDNSCLFHSVAYTCLDRARNRADEMRQIAIKEVLAKPNVFTAQVLEQPPSSYVQWMQNPKVWGGAIELQVFSEHFETEIVSFDYKYLREDHFGAGKDFKKRVFLIYTGQHYDAMAWAPYGNAPESKDKVIFSTKDDYAWKRAKDYVETLHAEACKNDSTLEFQKEWRTDRDRRKAAVGHSLTGKVLGWTCVGCTSRNNDNLTSCGTCGLPKSRSMGNSDSAAAPTNSSGGLFNSVLGMFGGSSSSNWSCKHCTFANKSSSSSCEMCGLPKN